MHQTLYLRVNLFSIVHPSIQYSRPEVLRMKFCGIDLFFKISDRVRNVSEGRDFKRPVSIDM